MIPKIDPEFQDLLRTLTTEEYSLLEKSILFEGIRDPLVVWRGLLVDGHNRFGIAEKHNLEYKTVNLDLPDRISVKIWMYRNQQARRNNTPQYLSYCRGKQYELEKLQQGGNRGNQYLAKDQNDLLPLPTAQRIAKETGVSAPTVKRDAEYAKAVDKIKEVAGKKARDAILSAEVRMTKKEVKETAKLAESDPALVVAVATGEKTIKAAKREIRKEKPRPTPTPATKSPRIIVAKAHAMPQVKSETIDIIITSPPYNLGASSWPMGGDGRTPRGDGIGYIDDMKELEYQSWQIACLKEMYRVAKPGASLFYNHKNRNKNGRVISPFEWLLDKGNQWIIRQEIIWDRGSTHNHSASLFWPHDERIYWMTKGKPTLPDRPVGMPTIWKFHGPVAGTWHPAPFCGELPRKCLDAVGREGVTVLDPFAGSCTTLQAALMFDYDAVGVDISKEYLERAKKENGWTKNLEI